MRTQELFLLDDCRQVILRSYHSILSPQRREYREHHHTACELSLFLSGTGTYCVRGERIPFSAGDVFLFGSDEAHCITEIDSEMDLLNIHFEPRLLWEEPSGLELLNLFSLENRNHRNRFAAGDALLSEKIVSLEGELREERSGCRILAKYLLFSVLVHLIRTYGCIDRERAISAAVPQTLQTVMRYINEHLTDRLTLREIANVACMSPTYFSTLFKKFNGVSPWKYITIQRVELATQMLRKSDMTKLEIAERCGFSSSSNFYKAFASITGKTPNEFGRER